MRLRWPFKLHHGEADEAPHGCLRQQSDEPGQFMALCDVCGESLTVRARGYEAAEKLSQRLSVHKALRHSEPRGFPYPWEQPPPLPSLAAARSVALKGFNPAHRCPKCEGLADWRFHAADAHCSLDDTPMGCPDPKAPTFVVEHMHRKCLLCRYRWVERLETGDAV